MWWNKGLSPRCTTRPVEERTHPELQRLVGRCVLVKWGFEYELICSHRTGDELCNMTTMAKGDDASDREDFCR